jgi:hypothetical protein
MLADLQKNRVSHFESKVCQPRLHLGEAFRRQVQRRQPCIPVTWTCFGVNDDLGTDDERRCQRFLLTIDITFFDNVILGNQRVRVCPKRVGNGIGESMFDAGSAASLRARVQRADVPDEDEAVVACEIG